MSLNSAIVYSFKKDKNLYIPQILYFNKDSTSFGKNAGGFIPSYKPKVKVYNPVGVSVKIFPHSRGIQYRSRFNGFVLIKLC